MAERRFMPGASLPVWRAIHPLREERIWADSRSPTSPDDLITSAARPEPCWYGADVIVQAQRATRIVPVVRAGCSRAAILAQVQRRPCRRTPSPATLPNFASLVLLRTTGHHHTH